MPKLINYDKEEIVFSRTIYKVQDREVAKKRLIKISDIKLVEETKKQTLLSALKDGGKK